MSAFIMEIAQRLGLVGGVVSVSAVLLTESMRGAGSWTGSRMQAPTAFHACFASGLTPLYD